MFNSNNNNSKFQLRTKLFTCQLLAGVKSETLSDSTMFEWCLSGWRPTNCVLIFPQNRAFYSKQWTSKSRQLGDETPTRAVCTVSWLQTPSSVQSRRSRWRSVHASPSERRDAPCDAV